MSLFSTKYKTTVYAQAQRVIDKLDDLPNTMKDSTLESILTGEDLIDVTLRNYGRSLGVKAEAAYAYGDNGYVLGRPSGITKRESQADEAFAAVLEAMHPTGTLDLIYVHVCQPNSMHLAWMKLLANEGYNRTTNELVNRSTNRYKVYLEDIDIYQPAALKDQYPTPSMDEWEWSTRAGYTPGRQTQTRTEKFNFIPNSGPIFTPSVTKEYAKVIYSYKNPDAGHPDQAYETTREIGSFTIDTVAGLDMDADYYHAMYTLDGVAHFFFYKIGDGVYPTLDVLYESTIVTGSYFPRAYFRLMGVPLHLDKTNPIYRDMKKLLKKAGLNYDDLANAIHDNEDSKDVQTAALTFDVRALWKRPVEENEPKVDQTQVELRYLYDFFLDLYGSNGIAGFTSVAADDIYNRYPPNMSTYRYHCEIKDIFLNTRLGFNGIYKKRVKGSIGPVGTYASEGRTVELSRWVQTESEDSSRIEVELKYDRHSHVYKKQVSHAFYDEIEIISLTKMYEVAGFGWYYARTLNDALTIPLDHRIMQNYPIKDREKLYASSVQLTFTSRIITETKWYQQEWFLTIVEFVGFAMTFILMGTDGGFFATIGAALASASAMSVVRVIINMIINKLIMMLVSEILVKVLGLEGAIVLALLAIAANMGGFDVPGLPSAQTLAGLGNGLIAAGQKEVAGLMQEVAEEAADFASQVKMEEQAVNGANALLEGPDNKLSPFIIFGETPSNYFGRTVHSGNIGVLALDSISTYVTSALKLPDLNDSIGEPIDGLAN